MGRFDHVALSHSPDHCELLSSPDSPSVNVCLTVWCDSVEPLPREDGRTPDDPPVRVVHPVLPSPPLHSYCTDGRGTDGPEVEDSRKSRDSLSKIKADNHGDTRRRFRVEKKSKRQRKDKSCMTRVSLQSRFRGPELWTVVVGEGRYPWLTRKVSHGSCRERRG